MKGHYLCCWWKLCIIPLIRVTETGAKLFSMYRFCTLSCYKKNLRHLACHFIV